MSPRKWKLLSTKDVSPSKWFPIESRTYELPDGRIVDDFTVTTLADVAMVIPLTEDKKVVWVNQFKPGIGDNLIQLPAGRIEKSHSTIIQTALHELEEEVGIKATESQLHFISKVHAFSTKATEIVHLFLAENCEFNSEQKLDENEDIEIIQLSFEEVEEKILNGQIWDAEAIAAWELAKKKFPGKFSSLK
ncbi:NUDIX hydrolase [Candidatus Woesebacteria bacterium]|nr:NUDIX hydrolase [Candidatus Woesebacteria bacterium]